MGGDHKPITIHLEKGDIWTYFVIIIITHLSTLDVKLEDLHPVWSWLHHLFLALSFQI